MTLTPSDIIAKYPKLDYGMAEMLVWYSETPERMKKLDEIMEKFELYDTTKKEPVIKSIIISDNDKDGKA